MRILIWQWGRRGAGPRFATCLAESLRNRPGISVSLSLCRNAEIMKSDAPSCEMPVRTYSGPISLLFRLFTAPIAVPLLLLRLWRIRPDLAICAMPGPLDLVMATALRLLGVQLVVMVHEASPHPGDGYYMQMTLQQLLCRRANALAALSSHVGSQLVAQGFVRATRPLIRYTHPPFAFNLPPGTRPPGPPRLLFFGRLLQYKGLDLLARAIQLLPPSTEIVIRVVGRGPDSVYLDALRACRGVTVENHWVPETEIGALLGWADALILPYREASQSGVAAAAVAAGRTVIATRVGGLREQLSGTPQAVLCEPEPASLARGIRQWLDAPPPARQTTDGAEVWRQAASTLLSAIGAALPPRPGKSPPVLADRELHDRSANRYEDRNSASQSYRTAGGRTRSSEDGIAIKQEAKMTLP
jgi:glycosyltransferase involved in cell wall biosynthesis